MNGPVPINYHSVTAIQSNAQTHDGVSQSLRQSHANGNHVQYESESSGTDTISSTPLATESATISYHNSKSASLENGIRNQSRQSEIIANEGACEISRIPVPGSEYIENSMTGDGTLNALSRSENQATQDIQVVYSGPRLAPEEYTAQPVESNDDPIFFHQITMQNGIHGYSHIYDNNLRPEEIRATGHRSDVYELQSRYYSQPPRQYVAHTQTRPSRYNAYPQVRRGWYGMAAYMEPEPSEYDDYHPHLEAGSRMEWVGRRSGSEYARYRSLSSQRASSGMPYRWRFRSNRGDKGSRPLNRFSLARRAQRRRRLLPEAYEASSESDEEQNDNEKIEESSGIADSGLEVRLPKTALTWLKSWKENDPEICCVCFDDTCSRTNKFVYCDNLSCEVIVHQNCYAIHQCPGSDEAWYCDRCEARKNDPYKFVSCALCPSRHGAFRRLEGPYYGVGWVHVSCAMWVPGVTISDQFNISKISVRNVPQENWKGQCCLCENNIKARYGACVPCGEPGCSKMLHISCGLEYGLLRMTARGKRMVRCTMHDTALSTKGEFNRSQRRSPWQKWVINRDDYLKRIDDSIDATEKCMEILHESFKYVGFRRGVPGTVEAALAFNEKLQHHIKEKQLQITKEIGASLVAASRLQRRLHSDQESDVEKQLKELQSSITRARSLNWQLERYYDSIKEAASQISCLTLAQSRMGGFDVQVFQNNSGSGILETPVRQETGPRGKKITSRKRSTSFGNSTRITRITRDPKVPNKNSRSTMDSSTRKNVLAVGSASRTGDRTLNGSTGDFLDDPSNDPTYDPAEMEDEKYELQADEEEDNVVKDIDNTQKETTPESDMQSLATSDFERPVFDKKGKGRTKRVRYSDELRIRLDPLTRVERIPVKQDEATKPNKKKTPRGPRKQLMGVPQDSGEEYQCGDCMQKDIPAEVLERLDVTQEYIAGLESTKHLRCNGFTGKSNYWDPRVFIECCMCKRKYHCGCPNPPIKNYPSVHELFVCQNCDEENEEQATKASEEANEKSGERLRTRKTISYKV